MDDHELLLDGLATWVRTNADDMDVVISATGWFDLIRDPAFPPDVTVMDLQLQEPISIETRVRTCLAAGSPVVVVSALETAEVRDRAIAAGASAFVAKSRPADEVVDAVRAAWHGAHARPDTQSNDAPSEALGFSAEEIEALRLYAGGYSPVDIALRMSLPFESVKNHLNRIREYYAGQGRAAQSKQELIRRAAEDGLLL